ncbi:MAG: hypothetical protein ACRDYA_12865 [Egibacteraceae bacterium]
MLLCPVSPVVAPLHDPEPDQVTSMDRRLQGTITVDGQERPYLDQMAWNIVLGSTRLPATAIPLGLDPDGLPVGAQIVGPTHGDRTTIAVAGARRAYAVRARYPGPPRTRALTPARARNRPPAPARARHRGPATVPAWAGRRHHDGQRLVCGPANASASAPAAAPAGRALPGGTRARTRGPRSVRGGSPSPAGRPPPSWRGETKPQICGRLAVVQSRQPGGRS